MIVIFISELLNCLLSLRELIKATNFSIDYKKWIIAPIISIVFSYLLIKCFVNTFIIIIPNLIVCIILFILIYAILIYVFNNVIIKKN